MKNIEFLTQDEHHKEHKKSAFSITRDCRLCHRQYIRVGNIPHAVRGFCSQSCEREFNLINARSIELHELANKDCIKKLEAMKNKKLFINSLKEQSIGIAKCALAAILIVIILYIHIAVFSALPILSLIVIPLEFTLLASYADYCWKNNRR